MLEWHPVLMQHCTLKKYYKINSLSDSKTDKKSKKHDLNFCSHFRIAIEAYLTPIMPKTVMRQKENFDKDDNNQSNCLTFDVFFC